MIRRYIRYGISAICLLLGWACQQEQLTEAAKGVLRISLTDAAWGVETKATPQELEDEVMGLFQIAVRNSAGYTLFEGDLTEPEVALPEGLYTVRAAYGTEQPLALDAPYYLGELSNVQIKAGKTTPITITCQVMNALLSIDWSNRAKFDQTYSDYGVQVKVGNASVTLRPDNTQSAYIQAGTPFSLTFVGTVRASQNQITTPLTDTKIPASLAAGDHCTLTLNIDSQTALQVQKADIDRTTIQESIPVEWLPAPTVTAQGFENNQLSFYETDAPVAQLNFDLSGKLQEMAFTLALDAESPYADLNGDYTLSTLTSEQKGRLIRAGFILPNINVQAGACLSLSGFLSNLLADNERELTNQITLTHLKANGRDIEQPLTYTITVKKPEMRIALPDYAIYTKQFTINPCELTGGKESTLRAGLKYQYRLSGTEEWQDCNDLNQHRFAEQPTERSFEVRAIYRNALTSNVVSGTLEQEAQTPNANMDEWTASTRDVKVTGISTKQRPFYSPWNDHVEHWWDTNNNESMLQEVTAAYLDYKCFPTTCYVTDGKGGYAAQTRSVATNAWNSEAQSAGKKRGIIYAGETDYDGNRSEGRAFASRPTGLTFDYMYESYDNERFGVYIDLLNETEVIATGSYESLNGASAETFTQQMVPLTYMNETVKATSIKISFYSVAKEDSPATRKVDATIPAGTYTIYGGSVLTIDNIQLIYDK